MNVFEEDYLRGYTEHEKHFKSWGEKASFLGDIQQCSIVELDNSGHAFIGSNRPDIGEESLNKKFFEYESTWWFFKHPKNGITTMTTQIGHEDSIVYADKCRLSGFTYRETVDENTQRCYTFWADSPSIYDRLIRDINITKKFIKFFKEESQDVINYYREHKFNLAAKSTNFFKDNFDIDKTEREKTNDLLQSMGILDQDKNITEREWQCIEMLRYGKSAAQTGDILGISRRTVETHFDHIKQKLGIDSKTKILETVD